MGSFLIWNATPQSRQFRFRVLNRTLNRQELRQFITAFASMVVKLMFCVEPRDT